MKKVTLSKKGQISLPAALRRRFGLKQGDRLGIEEKGDTIVLRPIPEHPLLNMRGKFQTAGQAKLTALLLQERRQERQTEREREQW